MNEPCPPWMADVHFVLESLDALTEARARESPPWPAFGLLALIEACQSQGLARHAQLPGAVLARGLEEQGWIATDTRLGQPCLTPAGLDVLGLLRDLEAKGDDAGIRARLASLGRPFARQATAQTT